MKVAWINKVIAWESKVLVWFLKLSLGMKFSLCCGVFIVLFLFICFLLWKANKKAKARAAKKVVDAKDEKKEGDKKTERSPFENWKYHFRRSVILIAPALGILYLIASWSQFKETFMQFVLTQKVLGLVFGIAVATYITTFSILSSPDWKWYAKFSRKVSGWAIVILLGYLFCSYAGCSLQKLGLKPPNLASMPPVEVSPGGTVSIIYKPEYIRQEINLDLLPGKKYTVYISSYMERKILEGGKVSTYDVPPNGFPWTLRDMENEFGKKARIELCPIKDKSSNFAGVVANIDGHNKWLLHEKFVQGKKLLSITLNDRQEESSFLKYKGLMQITLVPQK